MDERKGDGDLEKVTTKHGGSNLKASTKVSPRSNNRNYSKTDKYPSKYMITAPERPVTNGEQDIILTENTLKTYI